MQLYRPICMGILKNYEKFESPYAVTMANGLQTRAFGEGTILMEANINGFWNSLKLTNFNQII